MSELQKKIDAIVKVIKSADSLIITAGAGMGVDSGLPDFRGNEGFWKAYPALSHQDINFTDIASPYAFKDNPKLAWGFYGHRLNLYRETIPHDGFQYLKTIGTSKKNGYMVYTSNVDGQFQKAGFAPNRIVEIHGSIHYLQCISPCTSEIVSAEDYYPVTNDKECKLMSELPTCQKCGKLLRPNILMFDDWQWNSKRYNEQKINYKHWLNNAEKRVIIEIGAGTSIPSIRNHSENIKGTLIRINPRAPETNKKNSISLDLGGLCAIKLIYDAWLMTE